MEWTVIIGHHRSSKSIFGANKKVNQNIQNFFKVNMSKYATYQNCNSIRVAEIVRRHEGPLPKSLDSDENFKP